MYTYKIIIKKKTIMPILENNIFEILSHFSAKQILKKTLIKIILEYVQIFVQLLHVHAF